jgi:RNA polymerase sigma factor (sigma-70 family)
MEWPGAMTLDAAPGYHMDLPERFALGDADAFETLFRQHQADVYRWIICIVRDASTAEDLTVETFWRIYRSRGRFDPSREFGAWARRIATNAALDHLKTARREIPLPEHQPAPQSPDPAIQSELGAAIRKAFGQLPAKLQAVATLALIEEMPYAEIADALGITVAAVKTREFRAVRLLRQKLKHVGIES